MVSSGDRSLFLSLASASETDHARRGAKALFQLEQTPNFLNVFSSSFPWGENISAINVEVPMSLVTLAECKVACPLYPPRADIG
jgi:hypothetical protein